MQVVLGRTCVVETISEIGIVEILIRVGQPKAVTDFMTHGILAFNKVSIVQVVLIHFGHTIHDNTSSGGADNLVESQPSSISKISIANLHDSINRFASIVHLPSFGGQSLGIGVAILPIRHGKYKFFLPSIVQSVD